MRISAGLIIVAGALVLTNCATPQGNPIYQQTTKYKGSNPVPGQIATIQQVNYQTQAAVPVRYVTVATTNQSASYTRVTQDCLSKEANRKVIGTLAGGAIGALAGRKLSGKNKTVGTIAGAALGGAAGYGVADKTIHCSPTNIPIQNAAHSAIITPAYQPIPQSEDIYTASTTQITDTPNYTIEENVTSLGEEGTPGFYAVQNMEIDDTPMIADTSDAPQNYSVSQIPAQPSPQAAIIEPATINFRFHTVATGDTVYSIARTSCVSVAELKRTNNLNDDYYIRVGDEITIPAANCVD